MKKTIVIAILAAAAAFAGAAFAQEKGAAPQMSKEQQEMMAAMERMGAVLPQHKQLEYFVGDWKATSTLWMDPKAPPVKSEGKSSAKAIFGGRYIETTYDGSMMGQPFSGKGVMGHDNLAGKFVNTWMDSMSTGVWISYGSYDKAQNSYTFHGKMDDPMKAGSKVDVRAVVKITDPTHYAFEWYESHGGKENKTMQIDYVKI